MKVFLRKCKSAIWHTKNNYKIWQQTRRERQKDRVISQWLSRLNRKPPQILVGANFVDMGGTRMHMHSIHRYSSLNVRLAPDESVMSQLSPHEVVERLRVDFDKINTTGYVAVHSHVFPFFINWCQKTRQKFGTRWIHTHHNWYYPEFGRNGIEPWQEEFNRHFLMAAEEADVCLCVSRGQQKFLKEKFGLRTYHLPNGVDTDACVKGDANHWQQTTRIQPGFILFVGRNDPVKNPEFFVQLAAQMPDHRFVIAGQGISRAVITEEWKLPIPRNLEVLGQLTHAQVQDAIAASAVLVLCSKREGLPTLVLEGMIAGKPVVVPSEEGCMEAIGNGEFGFIYEANNFGDCIRQIELALQDSKVAASAKAHALLTYDWKSILAKLDKLYAGVSPQQLLN
jgi:glycosyltransferase involved in cell wall biosynthesis